MMTADKVLEALADAAQMRAILVMVASRPPYSGPNQTGTVRYALGAIGIEAFKVLGWPNPVKVAEMR